MKVVISFKNLEHTPSLDAKIQEKSEKFNKFFDGNIELQWTCFAKDKDHVAEVKLIGSQFTFHASSRSDSLYKSLDGVVGKLEKQISKKKTKWKDHIHHKHDQIVKELPIDEVEKSELLQQQWDELDDVV
jgi:putative sigma-54 modulation protein